MSGSVLSDNSLPTENAPGFDSHGGAEGRIGRWGARGPSRCNLL